MLKKVFSLLVSTIICLSLFSGCGEAETANVVMPDIVFVKFYWKYNGNINGEYIDKDGYIRSFEFTGLDLSAELEADDQKLSDVKKISQYTEARGVYKIHDMILKHYEVADDNSIVKTISQEELSGYYDELLKVNLNKKMKMVGYTTLQSLPDWSCMYGVKKDSNSIDEIVFIKESSNYYLATKEKHTDSLFWKCQTVFSQITPGW